MKRLAILLSGSFIILGLLGLAGARVNTSPSLPIGLYWQAQHPVTQGSLVWFCPPKTPVIAIARERGYLDVGTCASGTRPLLKQVVATSGDLIEISQGATRVNGRNLPSSAQVIADPQGQPLPPYQAKRTLGQDQVLLMALDHPRSFDGRYFGPIETRLIQGTLRPLWVWSP